MSQLLGDLRGIIRTAQTIEKYWNETTLSQDIDRLRSDLIALSLKSDPEMRRHIEYAVKHLTSQNTREHFLSVLIPLERVYAKAVVDADFLAIEGDKTQANCLPTPSGIDRPILILDNIRSAHNVGALMRSAECFQTSVVMTCGYTVGPDHHLLEKTSMGVIPNLKIQQFKFVRDAIEHCENIGYECVALEKTPKSKSIYQPPDMSKVALVLGNERHGNSPETLKLCSQVRHIPLMGLKNSLNVAVAGSIALSEINRQLLAKET